MNCVITEDISLIRVDKISAKFTATWRLFSERARSSNVKILLVYCLKLVEVVMVVNLSLSFIGNKRNIVHNPIIVCLL